MTDGLNERSPLEERFSELLSWERTKRREGVLVKAFFYSLLASLLAFSASDLLPPWLNPILSAPLLFVMLAAGFFLLRPWRKRESLKTVSRLDKALHLEERAITAWEILDRREKRATELLVLKEAQEKLIDMDPKLLFKKRLSWQAILALPVFLLWLIFVWLDVGIQSGKSAKWLASSSLAQKLQQFSREAQEKASAQGLSESMKVAQALEEAAKKRLRGEMSEKELAQDLAGMADKIGDPAQREAEESAAALSATTREGLMDLKAELQALRPTLLPDSSKWEKKLGPDVIGRMGTLPRLKGEIDRDLKSLGELDEKELSRYLDRLEQNVAAELDRRSLQEIREFLDTLLKGQEGRDAGEVIRESLETAQGDPSRAERVRGKGTLPGDEPGAKELGAEVPPVKTSAASHLKGLLGEGKSSGLTFKGEPSARKSKVAEQEVITSYRHQAEEELASERIPEALKETIRKYFLSLGMTESKK